MPRVPNTKQGRVNFYQSKITPWTTNATAIGTTSTAVTALGTLVTTAATAIADQDAAEAAFRAKVAAADLAVEAMCVAGANIISSIDTKARTAGASVYTLAEIPAPATPGPVGEPGTPFKITATLNPDGSLSMIWKCTNPRGCNNVIYHVYRKVESAANYDYLGGSGERKFVDLTVPQGVPSVMYQIQGIRSTSAGIAATFAVNFGTTSGETTVMSVVSDAGSGAKPAKVAA